MNLYQISFPYLPLEHGLGKGNVLISFPVSSCLECSSLSFRGKGKVKWSNNNNKKLQDRTLYNFCIHNYMKNYATEPRKSG